VPVPTPNPGSPTKRRCNASTKEDPRAAKPALKTLRESIQFQIKIKINTGNLCLKTQKLSFATCPLLYVERFAQDPAHM
jgi:hypothetical protein